MGIVYSAEKRVPGAELGMRAVSFIPPATSNRPYLQNVSSIQGSSFAAKGGAVAVSAVLLGKRGFGGSLKAFRDKKKFHITLEKMGSDLVQLVAK